ncbi:hypothetical protein EG327_002296 [Venturia inaequalis]|uniref:Major facilitator superfamily (MFS) profile domain-containing protein n=1 Tax=Venturia inaequalis TaxID=5025 RepID=A0A8H3VP63_VENIN|nr:hypothetical protein EG327_002296 [Venturia inaequalis]
MSYNTMGPSKASSLDASPTHNKGDTSQSPTTQPHHHKTPTHQISFTRNDPSNPRNWPSWKKWTLFLVLIPLDLSVSWGASGYSPAASLLEKEFHVSAQVATLGLSLYVIGLAFGPMLSAPLSESFGRNPVYIGSYGIYLLLLMGTALVQSIDGFLPLRFFSGLFSSVTVANYGGTVADMWHHNDTGYAMSLFLWAATAGSPTGYFLMSFVAQAKGWRAVFWALMGISGGFWLMMTVTLLWVGETRHGVILLKRARKERKETGNENIQIPEEYRRKGMKQLFQVALSRPFRFLFTESIIMFGALYNGYLYGLSFLFNGAFALVFGAKGHGFDTIGVGFCFLGIAAGITIGPVTNLWQERYFQKRVAQNGGQADPEARVQMAKVAAVVFPISLFWFAWTTYTSIHPIVPVIASAFWGWSFYTLILMTYTYTEDSYRTYAASALAGLGFIRNLAGGGFPLFGRQLFESQGYQKAGTILAALACALVPIPFILEKYGKRLRLRSPWAREHMEDVSDDDEEREPLLA